MGRLSSSGCVCMGWNECTEVPRRALDPRAEARKAALGKGFPVRWEMIGYRWLCKALHTFQGIPRTSGPSLFAYSNLRQSELLYTLVTSVLLPACTSLGTQIQRSLE